MRSVVLLFIALAGGCWSCSNRASSISGRPSIIDSLLDAQIKELTKSGARVSKRAVLDGKTDQFEFSPDSAGWGNELDSFHDLAMFQRPAYSQTYQVEDGLKDPNSNLAIREFRALQRVPVMEIRFFYLHEFGNLKKIEATVQQDNLLYATRRKVTLEFDDAVGRTNLVSYQIDGTQKMMLSDTVHYQVTSHVLYNN